MPSDKTIFLSGNIVNTAANPSYTFEGGTAVLSGTNSYAGGTDITGGAHVIFNTGAAIPATGFIRSDFDGYAGLADPTAVTAFVGRLDPTNFTGAFGFDTNPATSADPQAFAGTIDLSGLNNYIAFGTRTSAILYGNIIEASSAANYAFSGHGLLFLRDEPAQPSYGLAGSHGLIVGTLDDGSNPLLLVLSRSATNTYTGQTFAEGGGIVFDSPGALPAAGSLGMDNGSYLGFTEASGLTPALVLSKLVSYQAQSVLGFDSHDYINNLAYPSVANPNHIASPATVTISNLDLTNLFTPIYVGTASRAIIAGSFDTSNDGTDDYYFTGYHGGALQVDSPLFGLGRILYVGLPNYDPKDPSSVTLTNTTNSYAGGTVLQSGHLILGGNGVLGTGPLSVSAPSSVANLGTGAAPVTLTNNIVLQGGNLNLEPSTTGPLTLAGTISGLDGQQLTFGGVNRSVIISGNNTYAGGSLFTTQGTVTVQSNTGPRQRWPRTPNRGECVFHFHRAGDWRPV